MKVNHIYTGDCLEVMKDFPDNSVDLVLTDPPYNLKKDFWDDIEDYEEWIKSVIVELERVLKDNGSFYMFHSEMEVIADIMTWMKDNTRFIFRSLITWEKYQNNKQHYGRNVLMGVNNSSLRNYFQMSEYVLYYTFQDESGRMKRDQHAVYPVRDYIRSEIKRAKGKIILKEINSVLGTATNGGGVASACLSLEKSDPAMITKEHYEKLRDWLNDGEEYEFLREEYEDLREEYEDLRYKFNVCEKDVTRTWLFTPAEKKGHLTPKPVELLNRIIKYSSNEGDIVLDCFMGSGSTAVACKQLGRKYIGIELEEKYVEIAKKRLSQDTLLDFEKKNTLEVDS